jgi:hypothetical protein
MGPDWPRFNFAQQDILFGHFGSIISQARQCRFAALSERNTHHHIKLDTGAGPG